MWWPCGGRGGACFRPRDPKAPNPSNRSWPHGAGTPTKPCAAFAGQSRNCGNHPPLRKIKGWSRRRASLHIVFEGENKEHSSRSHWRTALPNTSQSLFERGLKVLVEGVSSASGGLVYRPWPAAQNRPAVGGRDVSRQCRGAAASGRAAGRYCARGDNPRRYHRRPCLDPDGAERLGRLGCGDGQSFGPYRP